MKNFILAASIFLLTFTNSIAQNVHFFSEGLGVGPVHQYGREALYKDQLAYLLYSGTLVSPKEGSQISTTQAELKWKPVKTDTSHRFRGDSFSNGYVYLTYDSKKEQAAVLNVTGNDMVFVNGAPRGGDVYRYGWMNLPLKLKKGKNEFYVRVARFGRFGGITAKLTFPEKPVYLSTEDLTAPNAVVGLKNDSLWVGIVIVNTSAKPLTTLTVKSDAAGKSITTTVPGIAAFTTRKVSVLVNGGSSETPNKFPVVINLMQNGKSIDSKSIEMETYEAGKQYSRTFVSDIDGSVQYYAVSPYIGPKTNTAPALFFSVHGAEVQAISQARAYKPKDWGVLVAPTNRRPRGFNWEDWGRLDALEVLDIAKKTFSPDPSKIYLTGHSMGGHGTWFLGATYPDKWAAIAPSAGYPTLSSYGSHDGVIPDSAGSAVEAILLRASNASNVLALTQNYKGLGVYIAHGDADRTVSVEYARQMKKILAGFHRDFSYYEHIGGEHWYGDISVDWPPIFNFFSWHSIAKDTATNHIDFTTANPGVSGKYKWATIHQQISPLKYSKIIVDLNKTKNVITGTTENVATLSLNLAAIKKGTSLKVVLDSLPAISYEVKGDSETIILRKSNQWALSGSLSEQEKNTARSGTFKEPFKNRMVFVYATAGTPQENTWAFEKARYDAETWYYRGNGAVELVADKDFNPSAFKDRGVVIYGNSSNNLAWGKLLANCPVQISTGKITVGTRQFNGDDLSAYFIWPRQDSKTASVAVISGTGKKGMQAANANQYFAGGSGFPDLMIFSSDMLNSGFKGVKMAGFFGNDWSVEKGEFEYSSDK
ncbi:carboxylesterase family protein [Dyadobacter psychrotolerans]|uniref:Alpha/beta hydrolase n=1 Tax=Dyadobacter psychrotolerans TaxID=2541721 RepID=A0A4R5DXV5_9BACT|nr:alpha/beta hydrolase-fold protein [Dyadobacter psychrotolerans]TDE17524.1 alpha/beta hydrolase [Dyadobacter psychrotolerans]